MQTDTIFNLCLEHSIDFLAANGKLLSILDMISEDDAFLDIQATYESGQILIGSIPYDVVD